MIEAAESADLRLPDGDLPLPLEGLQATSPVSVDAARPLGDEYAEVLASFQRAIDRRARTEDELARLAAAPDDDRERALRTELHLLRSAHENFLADLGDDEARRMAQAAGALADEEAAAQSEHVLRIRAIEADFGGRLAELDEKFQDSSWVTTSVLDDTSDDSPKRQFERQESARQRLQEQQTAEWDGLQSAYQSLAADRGWRGVAVAESGLDVRSPDVARQLFSERIEAARAGMEEVRALKLPLLFRGFLPLALLVVLIAGFTAPLYLLGDPGWVGAAGRLDPLWLAVACGGGVAAAIIVLTILYTFASMQQSEKFMVAQAAVQEADWLRARWTDLAERAAQRQRADFVARHKDFESQRQAALDRYQRAYRDRRDALEQERSELIRQEEARYAAAHAQRQRAFDDATEAERGQFAAQSNAAIARFESEDQRLSAELDEALRQRRRNTTELTFNMRQEWDSASRAIAEVEQSRQASTDRDFPGWHALSAPEWTPPDAIPRGIRLGDFRIQLEDWERAVSSDMRLAPRSTSLSLPCVLPFPEQPSLALRTPGADARRAAVELLQTAILRFLTLVPSGKLRITVLDPVGLGEPFAGLMHLADFDELLISKRIWTEPDQIEQRLGDLTAHMENVLQKYLRNEFATLEDYNIFAGEVAEPYHLLVVTDFPSKFSEIASRRLTSIITSGARCGVYTLLTLDPRLELPHGFKPAVIEENMPLLQWKGGKFHTARGALSRWPILVDPPPAPAEFTAIVRRVGEESRHARRVEVSFDRIAPKGGLWKSSARKGIDVPLGRAGASRLQHLRLGSGTSQHMLVAGKTGSGKSTFLHCLITNAALHYSPDELRFSLIDFKKGVEFKDYAEFNLPHADVVAIESDREFGVSALQRLDEMLQERGELFRRHGVQDLAGFRAAAPDQPLPRILLVIDEFQEFFVEDDKLSQTAALLLDRLIRQGRAFGMHVILGSQTLGGAYTLARSTLGQVAVRVALQCSEADAHLILSEDNTAARLLTRPGEAIYNDANGLLEGNHPFQIAWLGDDERETWLERIAEEARIQGVSPAPAIVFEGNIPSDPARNAELMQRLQQSVGRTSLSVEADSITADPHATPAPRIWLGESVEIRPATAIDFTRQSGSNLLLVGQDADAALGILATAAVTLAGELCRSPRPNARPSISAALPPIVVIDGSLPDSAEAQIWRSLAAKFAGSIEVRPARDAARTMTDLTAELERRAADRDLAYQPQFLVVYNIGRCRDLRKAEDDFGMGSFGGAGGDKPAEPGKLLADLLSGGPDVAMHTLIWCDSAGNVDRWLSRQSLRELEHRILFQMNASDSSNLIDSPQASRLGVHRAILYREETGGIEKFRPYQTPDSGWLDRAAGAVAPPAELETAADLDTFQVL